MKQINWFKYGQIIRHGFDLARIFPVLYKQQGTSKLIVGISSHIIEAPYTIWVQLLIIDLQLKRIISGLVPGWVSELSLNYLGVFRLETAVHSILG